MESEIPTYPNECGHRCEPERCWECLTAENCVLSSALSEANAALLKVEARVAELEGAVSGAASLNADMMCHIGSLKAAIAKAQGYLVSLPGQQNDSALGALLKVHPMLPSTSVSKTQGRRCHACEQLRHDVGALPDSLPFCVQCAKAHRMGYRCGEEAATCPDYRATGPRWTISAYLVRNNADVLLVHHKSLRMWLPIGGGIEAGERPAEAVLREVKEETGFAIDGIVCLGFDEHLAGERLHMNLAHRADILTSGEPVSDGSWDEYFWLRIGSEAPERTPNNVRASLRKLEYTRRIRRLVEAGG